MKKIGILILVIGLIGLIATLGMDTSVASSYGKRVHNIGLMNEKQNFLLVSIAMAIIGAILFAVENRNAKSPISQIRPGTMDENQSTRACPFCAENIKAQAVICRYCGRNIVPIVEHHVTTGEPASSLEKNQETASEYLARIEKLIRTAYSWFRTSKIVDTAIKQFKPSKSQCIWYLNIFAALLVIIGIITTIYVVIDVGLSSSSDASLRRRFIVNHTLNIIPIFLAALLIVFHCQSK